MNRVRLWTSAAVMTLALWGGYTGTAVAADAEQVTAAEAKAQASESWVMLEGHIVQSLGDELYRFEDASGQILVRIGAEDWHQQRVQIDTEVKVHGQVKKRGGEVEVVADRVMVVKQ